MKLPLFPLFDTKEESRDRERFLKENMHYYTAMRRKENKQESYSVVMAFYFRVHRRS